MPPLLSCFVATAQGFGTVPLDVQARYRVRFKRLISDRGHEVSVPLKKDYELLYTCTPRPRTKINVPTTISTLELVGLHVSFINFELSTFDFYFCKMKNNKFSEMV